MYPLLISLDMSNREKVLEAILNVYAKKYKKQDYLVSKTVILIQKTLHFVFYQKHAKKIEKPLALI